MDAESVAMSTSTYRTRNEIDQNDIQQIIKFMPKMVDKEIDEINMLGQVQNFIPPHTLFVKKNEESKEILDLDNFICNEQKELIGYIDEVVGQISDPFYSVVLYPAFIENADREELNLQQMFKDKAVYFVEKTKKLVFWNNLINLKACDASNMYDEAIVEKTEQEFSDDEQEQAYKKIIKKVKNQRKRKRRQEEGTGAGDKNPNVFNNSQNYKKREQKQVQFQQQPYPYYSGSYVPTPQSYPQQVPPYQQVPNMGMNNLGQQFPSSYSPNMYNPQQYQPHPPCQPPYNPQNQN